MLVCNDREDDTFMARTIVSFIVISLMWCTPDFVFSEPNSVIAVGPGKAQAEEKTEKTGQLNKDGAVSSQVMEKLSNAVGGDYIIGAEDVLDITVWRNADLSKTVQVRPDGRVSMPIIRDITAVGKTPTQLAEE